MLREKTHSYPKTLTIAIALLLGISLYFPSKNQNFIPIEIRTLISSITLAVFFLFLVIFKVKHLTGLSTSTYVLAFLFPTYLVIHGIIFDNFQHSIIGNSNRNLGVITYITCAGFFILGNLLYKTNPDALIPILLFLAFFQIIVISTKYFGYNSNYKLGSFFNSNPTSILTGVLAISLVIWTLEGEYTIKKYISFCLFFIFFVSINWIGSLQSTYAFTLTFVLFISAKLSNNLEKHLRIFFIIFGLIAFSFFLFVITSQNPNFNNTNTNSFDERLDIYKTAFTTIAHNPFFGTGVDHFNLSYFKYNIFQNLKLVDNAHSIPLHIASTTGLFGVIIFFGLIFKILSQSKGKHTQTELIARNIVIFYLFSSLFSIQVPGIEALFFFILGFLKKEKVVLVRDLQVKKFNRMIFLTMPLSFIYLSLCLLLPILQLSNDLTEKQTNYKNQIVLIEQDIKSIRNLDLLLKACEFSLTFNNKTLGLKVIKQMLNASTVDQRTIACILKVGEQFSDKKLLDIGVELSDQARK